MDISHLGFVPAQEIPLKGGAVLWIRRWRRWFQAHLELHLAPRGATWLLPLGSGWDERQPGWWWWANTHSPWRLGVKSEQVKLIWKCMILSALLLSFHPALFPPYLWGHRSLHSLGFSKQFSWELSCSQRTSKHPKALLLEQMFALEPRTLLFPTQQDTPSTSCVPLSTRGALLLKHCPPQPVPSSISLQTGHAECWRQN